jgi:hypothetical protein
MNGTTNTLSRKPAWWKILFRILIILVIATLIGRALNLTAKSLNASTRPAGFSRGMLQGALMPLAMPNLLLGKDVAIYAQNNTGVSYKLGYTAGVNACGALFFGMFFWRVSRWRKAGNASETPITATDRKNI